jgi:hypothetical protein
MHWNCLSGSSPRNKMLFFFRLRVLQTVSATNKNHREIYDVYFLRAKRQRQAGVWLSAQRLPSVHKALGFFFFFTPSTARNK